MKKAYISLSLVRMGDYMKDKLQSILYNISVIMEVVVAVAILIAIAISAVHYFFSLDLIAKNGGENFIEYLNIAYSIVIGIEFVKMLCRHNVDSVIEVLLFAIVRQMIVEHNNSFETLVGVFSVALLFLVRKYLFISDLDRKNSIMLKWFDINNLFKKKENKQDKEQ